MRILNTTQALIESSLVILTISMLWDMRIRKHFKCAIILSIYPHFGQS